MKRYPKRLFGNDHPSVVAVRLDVVGVKGSGKVSEWVSECERGRECTTWEWMGCTRRFFTPCAIFRGGICFSQLTQHLDDRESRGIERQKNKKEIQRKTVRQWCSSSCQEPKTFEWKVERRNCAVRQLQTVLWSICKHTKAEWRDWENKERNEGLRVGVEVSGVPRV